MALADKSKIGGTLPPFFKPENFAGDLALILEPQAVREGQSRFKDPATGQPKVQKNVTTRVTAFRTEAALSDGKPSSIETYTINSTVLARDLVEVLEEAKAQGDPAPALIAIVQQYQPKSGGNRTWVFRLPPDEYYDKAAAYYEAREAAISAAIDDAPSFD